MVLTLTVADDVEFITLVNGDTRITFTWKEILLLRQLLDKKKEEG